MISNFNTRMYFYQFKVMPRVGYREAPKIAIPHRCWHPNGTPTGDAQSKGVVSVKPTTSACFREKMESFGLC